MKQRFTPVIAGAMALGSILGAVGTTVSGAAPIDTKRAEAARLQQQIDANGMRISSLGEQYNGAQLAYDQATAKIDGAQQRLAAARARTHRIEAVVRQRAVQLYTSAGSKSPLDDLKVANVRELASRSRYASAASDRDTTIVGELERAKDQLRVEKRSAQRQQDDAARQRDAARQARADIEAANAQQQRLLGKVKGELATLMAEEQRARDEAARRAALARTAPRPAAPATRGRAPSAVDPGTVGGNFPNIPTSGGVSAVIAYARAQIGKPYVFATAGPGTFDCSGLTMMAWRQAGVSMDHFSGSQFNQFPHVSLSDLQPGDLVFKGRGGVDHVALYIGGGMQIAATHTGSYVKLQPLGTGLSGAVRPG